MASFAVWILVLLVSAGVPSNEAGSGKAVHADRQGEDNVKSSVCPNGEVYMDECNWARCGKDGVIASTFMICPGWTCALALARVSDEACYGHCTCSATSLVTSCERKGC